MKNLETEQNTGEEEKATHTLQNLQRVTLEYSGGLISICLGGIYTQLGVKHTRKKKRKQYIMLTQD